MRKRMPDGVFAYYLALGEGRSLREVAQKFGFSRQAVIKRAKKEDWRGSLARIRDKAHAEDESKAVVDHRKATEYTAGICNMLRNKVYESLAQIPVLTAPQALRAFEMATRIQLEIGREQVSAYARRADDEALMDDEALTDVGDECWNDAVCPAASSADQALLPEPVPDGAPQGGSRDPLPEADVHA